MVLWSLADTNALLMTAGQLYGAGGILCLTLWVWLNRDHSPAALPRRRSFRREHGMSLPVVLAMVALLSGTALYAVVLGGATLRQSQRRHHNLDMRTAAVQAAWTVIHSLRNPDGATIGLQRERIELVPSGIETHTLVREIERQALPAPVRRQDAPFFGRFFALRTNAAKAGQACHVDSLICLSPAGEVRILSWSSIP